MSKTISQIPVPDAPDAVTLPGRGNILLRRLGREAWEALVPEKVKLPLGRTLFKPNELARWVYFPDSGIVSLVLRASGQDVESSIVGREGMAGMPVLLGQDRTITEAVVQMQGEGWRVSSEKLEAEFKRGGDVQGILLAYMAAVLAQSTQLALCSHVHSQQERLTRWLLMAADRAGGPRSARGSLEFDLPPEFLAQMLGTNAATAVATVGVMQRAGLLTYSGDRFRLSSRRDMEDASCDCYSHIRDAFKSLVG